MGIVIKATAVSYGHSGYGAIDHAVNACEKCIKGSGVEKEKLDLLIYTGIYRDLNIYEPSIASLVQKYLKLNKDEKDYYEAKKTFSFDLLNGSAGFLNALHVFDGISRTGKHKKALIVAADAHPDRTTHSDFPYAHGGACALVERVEKAESREEPPGFNQFHFTSDSSKGYAVYAQTDFNDSHTDSICRVTIKQDKQSTGMIRDYLVGSIIDFTKARQLAPESLTFIINQPTPGFNQLVASALRIHESSIVNIYGEYGYQLSAALICGFHKLIKDKQIRAKHHILFAACGSGLAAGMALYTHP